MNGYDAYLAYQAVKLHFTTESFDYFKYGGKTKASVDTFNKRKDKYHFHKIGRLYNEQELPYFLAINFLKGDGKTWVGNLLHNDATIVYKDWLNWQQSRTYRLKEDLDKLTEKNFGNLIVCKDGQAPELLNLVYQEEIGYDSLVILDHFMNLTDAWNKKLQGDFIWDTFYKKFQKYRPFFNSYAGIDDSYKKIIADSLTKT